MSYEAALRAAGATVHVFAEFGCYQGDWWAKVADGDRTGWVHGYYGSCSGCDAFEGEFGYSGHDHTLPDGTIDMYVSSTSPEEWLSDTCDDCRALQTRLAEFGRGYLDEILPQSEAEAKAAENISWDMEANAMLSFIRANA